MLEYDKRIIDPDENIWTPFGSTSDTDICEGLEGYFADAFYDFADLDECVYGTLTKIESDADYPYYVTDERGNVGQCCFFLPARHVKAKEKKLRAFTVDEFIEKFPLLSTVTIRNKSDKTTLVKCVTGYSKTQPKVYLGSVYDLEELFKYYEYQDIHDNWKPFGVEE